MLAQHFSHTGSLCTVIASNARPVTLLAEGHIGYCHALQFASITLHQVTKSQHSWELVDPWSFSSRNSHRWVHLSLICSPASPDDWIAICLWISGSVKLSCGHLFGHYWSCCQNFCGAGPLFLHSKVSPCPSFKMLSASPGDQIAVCLRTGGPMKLTDHHFTVYLIGAALEGF